MAYKCITNVVPPLKKKKKAGIISLLDEEEPQLKVSGGLKGNLVARNVNKFYFKLMALRKATHTVSFQTHLNNFSIATQYFPIKSEVKYLSYFLWQSIRYMVM